MTEGADDDWGVVVDIDYDVSRWVRVPLRLSRRRMSRWATDVARVWAQDSGRPADGPWALALRAMVERAAGQRYSTPPLALLLRIRTPAGEALPTVDLAVLVLQPIEDELPARAAELQEHYASSTVELPTREEVDLANGLPGQVVAAHQRDPDGSIRTTVHVLWTPHEHVLAVLTAASYDIGALLALGPDLVALAGATRMRFGSPAELA